MNPLVKDLFHELADLSESERKEVFERKAVPQEVRAEVESLLSFDSTKRPDHHALGRISRSPHSSSTAVVQQDFRSRCCPQGFTGLHEAA